MVAHGWQYHTGNTLYSSVMFTSSVPDVCEVSVTGTSVDLFSEVAEVLCDNGSCSAPTFLLGSGNDRARGCSVVTWCLCSRFFFFLGCCSLGAYFFVNSCHSSSCGYCVNLTQLTHNKQCVNNYTLSLIRR